MVLVQGDVSQAVKPLSPLSMFVCSQAAAASIHLSTYLLHAREKKMARPRRGLDMRGVHQCSLDARRGIPFSCRYFASTSTLSARSTRRKAMPGIDICCATARLDNGDAVMIYVVCSKELYFFGVRGRGVQQSRKLKNVHTTFCFAGLRECMCIIVYMWWMF